MILGKLGVLTQRAPRTVLALAALFLVLAAVFGLPVSGKLPAGGYDDPHAPSTRAQAVLSDDFDAGGMPIVFEITGSAGVDAPQARAAAQQVVNALNSSGFARQVRSYWTAPAGSAVALVSGDHRTGLILAQIVGSDSDAPPRAHAIAKSVVGSHGDVVVKAGGQAIAYYDVNRQSRSDLLTIEAIATPFTFVVLVWVFGSAVAAILPMAVAAFAIAGTTAALRGLSLLTDVSVFGLNLATALCLALAIDYSLFIVNRFREELGKGKTQAQAMSSTMNTAGRTVAFSAVTVTLSLAVVAIFPMYFLRTLAYAGLIGVLLCLIGALLVTPALLTLLGDRINKWDLRPPVYRLLGRTPPDQKNAERTFFYRSAVFATRHAVPVVVLVTALFLGLGAPVLGMKVAYPDDRMLPTSADARQTGDTLRASFPEFGNAIRIVFPDAAPPPGKLDAYAARLSRIPGVTAVAAPGGTFVNAVRVSADSYGSGLTAKGAYLTVSSSYDPYSDSAKAQLADLKQVGAPAAVLFSGSAQQNIDGVNAIKARVPLVLALVAATSAALLFLLTGSVLLPVKALFMNILSLGAAFGAMVWIFQDGHLGGFGTTTTGQLNAAFPPLIFCVAFGLSMDYEVFVLSRMHEEWTKSHAEPGAHINAVAIGLARTGRIVTVAAAVMAIVFAAIIASRVQAMRMLGTGLAVTVLLDAFLIRTILVPAVMGLLGRAAWWAPRPLRLMHDKLGLSEEGHRLQAGTIDVAASRA